VSRALLRVASEGVIALFHRGHAYIVCEPSRLASGHDLRNGFSKKFVLRQKFVQQHSGDWTMTGKVPVARVEGALPLPRTKSEG